MHVAVVIVGFRNAADITACLAALDRADYADFEVVICENGGAASYAALKAAIPARLKGGQIVTVHQAPGNLGYAGGVNFGMAAASQADAWWALNPDTEPEPTALGKLVERLAAGGCEAVGGTLCLSETKVQAYGGRWRASLARAESIGRDSDLATPVDPAAIEARQDYLSGASMLIGSRFLETVGPMREDYFLYCEEVEWFLRGRAHGMRLGFAPDARVLHHAGSTTGSNDRSRTQPRTPVYLDERNKILVTRDCFPALLPVAATAALLLLILRFARRRAWRQLGYALQGWSAGLANRRGPPAWIDVGSG